MSNSSIWPIDRTLPSATAPGQSEPRNDGNEGVHCKPQSSSISGTTPSNCLVSYPGHLLGESYPFAEMQSVHSTAPADWRWSYTSAEMQWVYSTETPLKPTGLWGCCDPLNGHTILTPYQSVLDNFMPRG